MEVYFWGLRNLKRSKIGGIRTPKMNIECLKTMIYSEPLKDTKNDGNFLNPITNADLVTANPLQTYNSDCLLSATSVSVGKRFSFDNQDDGQPIWLQVFLWDLHKTRKVFSGSSFDRGREAKNFNWSNQLRVSGQRKYFGEEF